jgi:hypothetical protein
MLQDCTPILADDQANVATRAQACAGKAAAAAAAASVLREKVDDIDDDVQWLLTAGARMRRGQGQKFMRARMGRDQGTSGRQGRSWRHCLQGFADVHAKNPEDAVEAVGTGSLGRSVEGWGARRGKCELGG